MNNEEIKELIKLVSKLGLGKVEIEKEGFKINIKGPNLGAPMAYAPRFLPLLHQPRPNHLHLLHRWLLKKRPLNLWLMPRIRLPLNPR